MAAVARASGVAKGTVYLRWPTRDDLIVSSAAQIARAIVDPAPGPFDARLRDVARHVADTFESPEALRVLLRIDADREVHTALFRRIYHLLQESTNQVIFRCIRQAQASGEVRADVSPRVFTRAFVGALFVEALAQIPTRRIDKEFIDTLVTMMVAAVKA